ncbi:hypothetical protein Cgig2_033968 [Carnegiea gigantea]|uniref:FAS1 domain-containing protein n=1 Tax=Carnegiea gigantea TaxID=171969 RepID=A0A9Q1KD01_9CARY|nr:hypothetical protein Cgig2_033968 [Carnegiea gigantea]
MATVTAISIFSMILVLIPLAFPEDTPSTDQPINDAIEEMQRANYFAFVILLNMSPPGKIPSNITFLMPNNRMLAKAAIPKNGVVDFLLRHSIPTPLGFEYLKHFPTGSIIPSSKQEFMLNVFNNGRKCFFLNNVKLVSPNLCVSGSSIRCHGIDGVLVDIDKAPPTPLACPQPPVTMAAPPALPSPPLSGGSNLAPGAAPQPTGLVPSPPNSGSSCCTSGMGVNMHDITSEALPETAAAEKWSALS